MRILEGLRAATTDSHQRLHCAPALCKLADKSVTIGYYQNALKKFYGFYKPFEARYAASSASELHQAFPTNGAINNLQADIKANGLNINDLDILKTSHKPFNLEESLAYLYVREGSNLGGRVISKNLKDTLNIAPETQNKFFWGHGMNTGDNWKLYMSALQNYEDKVDIDDLIKFAQTLFQNLEAWLQVEEKEYA